MDGSAHEIVRIERLAPSLVAQLERRVGEEGDARDAEIPGFARAFNQPVDRPARDTGQGRDGLLHPPSFRHEKRPDKIRCVENRLGDQRSRSEEKNYELHTLMRNTSAV